MKLVSTECYSSKLCFGNVMSVSFCVVCKLEGTHPISKMRYFKTFAKLSNISAPPISMQYHNHKVIVMDYGNTNIMQV